MAALKPPDKVTNRALMPCQAAVAAVGTCLASRLRGAALRRSLAVYAHPDAGVEKLAELVFEARVARRAGGQPEEDQMTTGLDLRRMCKQAAQEASELEARKKREERPKRVQTDRMAGDARGEDVAFELPKLTAGQRRRLGAHAVARGANSYRIPVVRCRKPVGDRSGGPRRIASRR